MAKIKDLSNKKFGLLTALELNGRNPKGYLLWKCRCDCGGFINVTADHLKSGNTRSCGCLIKRSTEKRVKLQSLQRKKEYSSFIGKKYNKLLILDLGIPNKFKVPQFKCVCDCGTMKNVSCSNVINGKTKSCGCLRLEIVSQPLGEKHHNWNPNKTREEKELERKNHTKHVHWAKAIKKIHNYVCFICKKNSRRLESHHLNCWSDFPEQRYDLNNGVCLCVDCHKFFHKIYGLKPTKEMFEEYIQSFNLI